MSIGAGASQAPKTFTVNQAQELLPIIIPVIEHLQGLYQALESNNTQIDEAAGGFQQDRMQVLNARQLELAETFESSLAQLEGYGCLLKDLQQGLVDFYSFREGRLVFLCWKLDESQIRHWHTLDGGFGGRQPIDVVF
jgi:hypothetical protein